MLLDAQQQCDESSAHPPGPTACVHPCPLLGYRGYHQTHALTPHSLIEDVLQHPNSFAHLFAMRDLLALNGFPAPLQWVCTPPRAQGFQEDFRAGHHHRSRQGRPPMPSSTHPYFQPEFQLYSLSISLSS